MQWTLVDGYFNFVYMYLNLVILFHHAIIFEIGDGKGSQGVPGKRGSPGIKGQKGEQGLSSKTVSTKSKLV